MKKSFLLAALIALFVSGSFRLSAQSATLVPVIADDNAVMLKVSDNGLWAVGYYNSDGNEIGGTLWNLSTYEATQLSTGSNICSAHDLTDDGSLVVGSFQEKPAYWQNGVWTILPMPAGGVIGQVVSVTPDGSKMGGRVWNASMTISHACIWENNELVDLNIPLVDHMGENANFNEIVGISADGNTILGCLNYNVLPNRTAFILKNGNFIMFGAQYYDPNQGGDEYNFFDVLSMSPDGKYVTGDMYYVAEIWVNEYYCPFRYDVENDVVLLYANDEEMASFAVDNAGTLYGASPLNYPLRSPYFVKDGQWVSFEQEIVNTYGIDIFEQTAYDGLGSIFSVSADGKTIVGTNGVAKNNWVFKIGSITGLENKQAASPMKAFVKGNKLILSGEVKDYSLYDLQGKRMMGSIVNGVALFDVSHLPEGIYVVRMSDSANNSHSSKVRIGN